jgi:predicted DNA binding CopG/RHH family protein
MKKKIKYTDENIKLGKVVKDFLPSPSELAMKDETARITINLNKASIEFFKTEAKKVGVPYQKLIRKVVDLYANHHQS